MRVSKRAAKNLVLREAYNTDLRTIRSSGQGSPAAYRVAELTAELNSFLPPSTGWPWRSPVNRQSRSNVRSSRG